MSEKFENLPYEGEYRKAPSKRFNEVIVFVHHFGGQKRSTRRHQEMVLAAGYDCVIFNLHYNSSKATHSPNQRLLRLFKNYLKVPRSFISIWTDELNEILNQIPGPKIIYSLSSPSTAVVGCLGPKKRQDIQAWVCDCGPFLKVWQCFWNYSKYEAKRSNFFSILFFNTFGFLFFGGVFYRTRMRRWLRINNRQVPTLSLRAGQDRLVPAHAVSDFFSLPNSLRVESETFAHSNHLDAIKTDASRYQSVVLTFLQNHSSFLETFKR